MLTQKQVLKKIEKGESFEGVEIGDVDFYRHTFDKPVDFSGALFKGTANFQVTKFKNVVDFANVQISGIACFRGSQFENKANFFSAQFENVADFSLAHLHGESVFAFANFRDKTTFFNARFQNETKFMCTQFHGNVDFSSVFFESGVYFNDACFKNKTCFINTRFGGDVFFIGHPNNQVFSNFHVTELNEAFFKRPENLMLHGVNLSKCSLLFTDLSKAIFIDITWARKLLFLGSRNALYDEISEKKKEKKYPLIEKIYRDLKKNYENRGSYGEAGDFHYGEMEMRRLSQKPVFRYVSLLWLYKTLSGYGEKHWRALFWLGAFLLAYLGTYRFIEYNALPLKDGLWNSFVHALEIISFQRNHMYPSLSPLGKLADIFLTITFSLQATLAILAIKRKFKR